MLALALALIVIAALAALFAWASSGTVPGSAKLSLKQSSAPARGSSTSFRVATWNIGYASGAANNLHVLPREETLKNLARMREFLKEQSVDLALLQECDFDSSRSGGMDQADALAEAGFARSARAVNWDKRYIPFPYGPPHRNFGRIVSGQATLSRFELEKPEIHIFEKPAERNPLYNAFYLDRLALACEMRLGGTTVIAVNIHLEAFVSEARLRQAAVLRDWLETWRHRPLIVGGDFNARSADVALEALTSDGWLRNAASGRLLTFSSWQPFEDIDHILVSPHFEVRSCEAFDVEGNPSDHRPLVAELSLSSGGGVG